METRPQRTDFERHRYETIGLGGVVIRARRRGGRGPRHALQRLAVRPGIGIGQRPPGQQPLDLLPQGRVRLGSDRCGARLGVRRELGQQPDERVGDGFVRGLRGGLEDIEDRVHGHAIGRIGDELAPLRKVAPSPPAAAGFRAEGPNEPRRPPPQRRSLGAARRLELGGDLQQVADDHLIVPRGFGLRMLINSLRDHRRLRGRGPGVFRRRGQGRPRQAHPQLGRPRIPFPDRGTVLVRELQALVRERVELYVRPGRQAVSIAQAQGCPVRSASMASVRSASATSPSSTPRRNVMAPRWCRCSRPASSRNTGCLGSVATPSITS